MSDSLARDREANRRGPDRSAILEALEPRTLLSTTLFYDGFEEGFPGLWEVEGGEPSPSIWGSNYAMAAAGSWSAFCADNGDNARNVYDNGMQTYMARRGISLVGYPAATLSFQYWLNCEQG